MIMLSMNHDRIQGDIMSIPPPPKDPSSTLNLNYPTYVNDETDMQEANDDGLFINALGAVHLHDYRFTNHGRIDQPMMAIVESFDTPLMINCNIFMEATT